MPKLQWDPTDFLDCLEVFPTFDEDKTWANYKVEKNGLTLDITVWPYESTINLSLHSEGSTVPLTAFTLFVRGPVQYVQDKWSSYLELPDCVIHPIGYSVPNREAALDHAEFKHGISILVTIKPDIQIRFEENATRLSR